ncbi:ParB N-terminal domain-containing protein [Streptomyces caniscabiei]|uniref:ParB N-terminal domain-containing protein n=1 Tax=Streptomyces caniscabiei TaxID=2746961 RepID=A0A927KZ45_9ACTN|nr:ParB N-terminal domain-containing protein [Streptomyces caniscabiei]MBD9721926.1 ParB N-terminal domain-containing protein [Streptomyces caniscabiei]MDX3509117.1 ParB N-terminal domain-containing protein [Streptomyces caniscabiei]MDX3717130.1 ParB N-terminal domain-containing protein [Streptomyces caniscabiei]WEO22997.1 ParB N-terminal domain-containing protein [Streptomyces caniscabiei]
MTDTTETADEIRRLTAELEEMTRRRDQARAEAFQYRTALQGVARRAASAVVPAADRAALRDRIVEERLASVLRWVTSDVVTAQTEFGSGYRAAQRDIRDLIRGRFDADAANELRRVAAETPPAETHAAAVASCPGYETSPNPCRCPCYGCKHHCAAHNPDAVEVAEPESGCAHCGGPHDWDDCEAYTALVAAETPAAAETHVELQVWPLQRVLTEVRCGSEDWPWEEEWADLARRHAETGYLDRLAEQIRENGITMPVLIGSDGRLWDGHHRLCVAVRLGIGYVPVEIVPPRSDQPGPAVEAQPGKDTETREADPDCEHCDGSGLDPDAYFVNHDTGTWTHTPCSECLPEDDDAPQQPKEA